MDKKGLEISMGMMITIIIAVITLILAIGLVRNLFTGATQSVTDINAQLTAQIRDIFSQGSSEKIFVLLGNDRIGNIRADGKLFSFWAGARTNYGTALTNRSDIQFKLELDPTSECYTKLKVTQVSKWFVNPTMPNTGVTALTDVREIKTTADDMGSARIQVQIPEGTPLCKQEVFITFFDNTQSPPETIAGASFTINVLRKSLLG